MEATPGGGDPPAQGDKAAASSTQEIDAATLARVIREQEALPLTNDEAESLAQALETSKDGEEFLANAVSTVRFLVDRIERSTPDEPPPVLDL